MAGGGTGAIVAVSAAFKLACFLVAGLSLAKHPYEAPLRQLACRPLGPVLRALPCVM